MAWKFIVLYVSYQGRNQRKSFRDTCISSPTVGGAVGCAVGGKRYQCTWPCQKQKKTPLVFLIGCRELEPVRLFFTADSCWYMWVPPTCTCVCLRAVRLTDPMWILRTSSPHHLFTFFFLFLSWSFCFLLLSESEWRLARGRLEGFTRVGGRRYTAS